MQRFIDDCAPLVERVRAAEIIYTDLDGTLLGAGGTLLVDGQRHPSTRTAKALVAIIKAGIPVVPVTGRSNFQLVEIVRMCGLYDFIGESGALITWWTGTVREARYIAPLWDKSWLDGRTPFEVIRQTGATAALLEKFKGQLEYHSPWHEPREASELLRGRIDLQRAQEFLDTFEVPLEIVENGAINPKVHTLDEPLPGGETQMHAYHVVPAGVSKAVAIKLDLQRRGIDPQRALMIGDGMADLQCAPSVGVALMVENALSSPNVVSGFDRYPNAALTHGARGDGWAHMAQLILS